MKFAESSAIGPAASKSGEAKRVPGKIEIVAYDPGWPLQFERQAALIRQALGPVAVAVEHVGSTAVVGLAAKPVLDIALTVLDASLEATYAPALAAAGFTLRVREPEWFEHRMFKHAAPPTNLHVFSAGCPEVGRMKRFRDWLRANESDRRFYERSKRELAAADWEFVQQYADAKTAVVTQIMERAAVHALL